ncbi:MAG: response regulator [Sphingobium sp.]|nr:response regulator [Sphingobium sp.]
MGQKSVLIVDDSAVSRMVLGRALTEQGYHVCAVNGGNEALDWIDRHPPADLVITDLHMPDVDGLHLIRYLRARRGYTTLPIFVLTAGAEDQEKQQVREAGATGWIVKPFDTAKLVNAIERVAQ